MKSGKTASRRLGVENAVGAKRSRFAVGQPEARVERERNPGAASPAWICGPGFRCAQSGLRGLKPQTHGEPGLPIPIVWAIRRTWRLDRKSTRLNSSHANISYAVFCLKKKTHQVPVCGGDWIKRVRSILEPREGID